MTQPAKGTSAGHQHKTVRLVLQSRRTVATVAVGTLALMLAFHVVFGSNGMLAYEQKRQEVRRLQRDIDRVQKENERIAERIRELKTDPQAIEKEAREQLRYARPGEVVYTMPEPLRVQPPSNATADKR